MANRLKFFQLDVFTKSPFSGNPLAVFPWADGLPAEIMQKIAREMNLSETTFVMETEGPDHDFSVRVFTPSKEIPFGGHPTLGTAHTLKHTGQLKSETHKVVLGMGVGPVPVEWESDTGFMTQPKPQFTSPLTAEIPVLAALGLDNSSLHPDYPVQQVSTGFPALLVPLKYKEDLGNISINLEILKDVLGNLDLIYPFFIEKNGEAPHIRSRSFAPFIGIPEDPATGSVAGALGAYLLQHQVFKTENLSIQIFQGLEMGRPSEISVEVSRKMGTVNSVRVGGNSCVVLEGELFF